MHSLHWFLTVLIFHSIVASAQEKKPLLPVRQHAFTVIAHRGSRLQFPENSLAAFRDAISAGADYAELDLRTTADSILVIIHDNSIDRTTNGKGRISEMTYREIRKTDFKGQRVKNASAGKIPSFEEVLQICRHRIFLYIDFKDADPGKTFQLIKQYGMEKEVIVYINAIEQYHAWKTVAPAIPLILSLPGEINDDKALTEFLNKTPLLLLDGDYDRYTCKMLTVAASYGIKVWPDIQGSLEAQHWETALKLGFSGLQTDHPRELVKFLKKRHIR